MMSKLLDGLVARLLLRLALLLLVLVSAATLSGIGLVWIVDALTLYLVPRTGAAAAHALAGAAALAPLVLLVAVLLRLSRRSERHALGDSLRQSVRENPWESLGMAFFLGFTQHGRHPDRAHILMEMIGRRGNGRDKAGGDSDSPQSETEAHTGR